MRSFVYFTIAILLLAFPATAGNLQGQLQGQKQGQLQAQGQLQGQGQIANGKVSTSTDVDAEPAYAPNPAVFQPTVRCRVPGSITGGGGGVFSFGIAGSMTDDNCERIEKAKACTEAMVPFPQFKSRCEELWSEAFMTEEQRMAHDARKKAIAAQMITFYKSGAESVAWNGERVVVE